MTLAKLSPLALLILFGVAHFAHQPQMVHASEIASPGWSNWVRALVLLMFPLSGSESDHYLWREDVFDLSDVIDVVAGKHPHDVLHRLFASFGMDSIVFPLIWCE